MTVPCGSPPASRSCRSRGHRRSSGSLGLVAPEVVRRGDVGNVLGGEVAARPVDHVAQLAGVDEQRLAGTSRGARRCADPFDRNQRHAGICVERE